MNTLGHKITTQFISEDQRTALLAHWAATYRDTKEVPHYGTFPLYRPAHYILYLSLLGRDWRSAFKAPTRPSKVQGGAQRGWPMWRDIRTIQANHTTNDAWLLAPFNGLVTQDMLDAVRKIVSYVAISMYNTNAHELLDAGGRVAADAYDTSKVHTHFPVLGESSAELSTLRPVEEVDTTPQLSQRVS